MTTQAAIGAPSLVMNARRGMPMSDLAYERRHNGLRLVLLLHLCGLATYAAVVGAAHVLAELTPVLVLLAVASSRLDARLRATAVALGLYACSAMLVHLAHGQIEAHFHFFVVLALISLYRDLLPYLVGVGFVLVEHFVVGMLFPGAVFSHDGDALLWAVVHATFVAAASAAHIVSWRTVERGHREERQSLTAEVQRLAAVVDSAGIAIFSEDLDGVIRTWNAAATALFGYEPHEIVGRSAEQLMALETQHELAVDLACVAEGRPRAYETLRRAKNGDVLEVALVVSPVRREDGVVVAASVMARDISRRRRAEERLAAQQEELAHQAAELRVLAFRDPLTGLANRTLFLDRLQAAQVRHRHAAHTPVVLMIDLDGFKLVNDSAGHPVGDALLRHVAARLLKCVRSSDTVARLGGDEFALLVDGTVEAEAVAGRILKALARPYEVAGRQLTTTASIGIASCTDGDDADAVLRSADVALYAAKAEGKNRAVRYQPAMYETVLRRTSLEADLRTALRRKELRLHYQPLVSLCTGEVDGFEALVRWQHPEQGLVPPGEFIPVAEASGLIVPIGAWVVQEAAREAARLSRLAGRAITMAVNVSARQLTDERFAGVVEDALTTSGVSPEQLVLEVTESALADSAAEAVSVLTSLRAAGVRVAIDDFGTGYSSLDRLRTLPVDQLKIDRSFIAEVVAAPPRSSPAQAPVLSAIIAMAEALGLQVVAEGVETREQLATLRRLGCDLAQGFLLCRPAPAREAGELLGRKAIASAAGAEAATRGEDLRRLVQASH